MLTILTISRVYRYEEMILSRWPYIFVGCLVFVLLVIALITWRCCVRRRRRRAAQAQKAASMGISTGASSEPQYKVVDGAASSVSLQDMGKPNYDDDPYAYRGHKQEEV